MDKGRQDSGGNIMKDNIYLGKDISVRRSSLTRTHPEKIYAVRKVATEENKEEKKKEEKERKTTTYCPGKNV